MGRDIHYRTCCSCEAMCGPEVHVEEDRVALPHGRVHDKNGTWLSMAREHALEVMTAGRTSL